MTVIEKPHLNEPTTNHGCLIPAQSLFEGIPTTSAQGTATTVGAIAVAVIVAV